MYDNIHIVLILPNLIFFLNLGIYNTYLNSIQHRKFTTEIYRGTLPITFFFEFCVFSFANQVTR